MMAGKSAILRAENRKYGRRFISIDLTHHQTEHLKAPILAAWRNADHLVQLFDDSGHQRLTINRAQLAPNGQRWADGYSWDELMVIKRLVGFGDRWAVEVYPPEAHVVDVANMRHLWLIDEPPYGWRNHPITIGPNGQVA